MKTTQIGMSTVMIDRQKIPDLKFPEERELCEDARAWVSLFHRGYRFHGLNEVLLLYRVRQNQLSGNKLNMALNTRNVICARTTCRLTNGCTVSSAMPATAPKKE